MLSLFFSLCATEKMWIWMNMCVLCARARVCVFAYTLWIWWWWWWYCNRNPWSDHNVNEYNDEIKNNHEQTDIIIIWICISNKDWRASGRRHEVRENNSIILAELWASMCAHGISHGKNAYTKHKRWFSCHFKRKRVNTSGTLNLNMAKKNSLAKFLKKINEMMEDSMIKARIHKKKSTMWIKSFVWFTNNGQI